MIELTKEQAHFLAQSTAAPPHIVNPQTKESFVLIPLEEYLRLKESDSFDDDPWTDEERDLLRQQACELLDTFGQDK